MSALDVEPSERSAVFPQEIFESIIDYLQTSCSDLKACSLVCRAFLPRTRSHLFATLEIPAAHRLKKGVIRVQSVGRPYPMLGYPESKKTQTERFLALRLQSFLSIPDVCTLVRHLNLHAIGFVSWGKHSPYHAELSKLDNLHKVTLGRLALSPISDILARNQNTLEELHLESPCFADPADMVVSLQRNLQSLRILTLEGGPLVTKAGSWLDPEFLEKDQMRRSKAETTVSTRAQLDMLSLKGLNLSGTELEPFLRILFNTDPWSTFDVSGLRRLEISFSIYSNHLMDYGSLLQTVGSTLRHLELLLKTDESIRQWLIMYVTRMMAEVPVLTGFRDVVKQLRQLQFFSLTCEDSLPAIHNIIDQLSLLSSLEDVQITLITPGLDLMLLTPNFDASLASIIDANAGMNTITIRFQYHFESISYIQRGVRLLEEVPGVVDTSGTGILEEYLPLTSKMVSVRLLRAFGTYDAHPRPEGWETME